MEILRAVVDDAEDIEIRIHGDMFDVLGAVLTVIQGVHEAFRREDPLKSVLFRQLLTDYLTENVDDVFAPIGDQDLKHYADLSVLGALVKRKRQKEANDTKEEPDGTENECEP